MYCTKSLSFHYPLYPNNQAYPKLGNISIENTVILWDYILYLLFSVVYQLIN